MRTEKPGQGPSLSHQFANVNFQFFQDFLMPLNVFGPFSPCCLNTLQRLKAIRPPSGLRLRRVEAAPSAWIQIRRLSCHVWALISSDVNETGSCILKMLSVCVFSFQ